MQQNIDTYFKEKLQHREFEMKDAHWSGAEALLEAAEKKKRRVFLFWWLGGLLPVVAIAAFFLFGDEGNMASKTSENPIQSIHGEIVSGQKESSDKEQFFENSHSAPATPPQKAAAIPPIQNRYNGINEDKEAIVKSVAQPNDKVPNQITETAFKPTDHLGVNLKTEVISPENIPFVKQEAPGLLSQIMILVEGDFDEKHQTKNLCLEPSPFHFGVSAAQLMQVMPRGGESLITGFYGGFVFQYDLNNNWFVSSGIGYMRRDGHFEATKMTEMRNYRFGLELMESQLRPTSLHYVSMPLSVAWKKGHNLFEGGIIVDYLTGVRGEIGKLERVDTEHPTKEFVPYEKAWITEEGFTKFNISPTVGYRYRVNKELSFGLSAQFNLRPLTNKEPVMGDYILQEDDRFNLRLNAVYLLK